MKKLLLCILLLLGRACYSQEHAIRNFNIFNGLPSNHIYNCIIDRHGYLWFTSPKGVIKYNGYNFRIFNTSDGLSRDDVWYLFEDRAGRIWLGTISNELGYIYNDKYYGLTSGNSQNAFYPRGITNYKDAITFSTAYVSNSWRPNLYYIDSNKIKEIQIPDSLYTKVFSPELRRKYKSVYDDRQSWFAYAFIEHDTLLSCFICNTVCTFSIKDTKNIKLLSITPVRSPNLKPVFDVSNAQLFDNYILFVHPGYNHSLIYFDRRTGDTGQIPLKNFKFDEPIQYFHHISGDNLCYVIAKDHYLSLDVSDNIRAAQNIAFRNVSNDTNLNGDNVIGIFRNAIWGTVFTTKRNGAFISSAVKNCFKPYPLNLRDYTSLGVPIKGNSYWWNSNTKTLAEISQDNQAKYYSLKNVSSVNNVISYSRDSLLLLGQGNYFFVPSKKNAHALDIYNELISLREASKLSNGKLLTVSNYGFNINDLQGNRQTLSNNRFQSIATDKLKDEYWAYNNYEIVIYNARSAQRRTISSAKLKAAGIKNIETIAIDSTYGNIIIKDNNDVLLYDEHTNVVTALPGLENTNKTEVTLLLRNGHILLIGKLGLVKIEILGKNRFSIPYVAPNLGIYSYIYDIQANGNQVILNTNKGFFNVHTDSAALPLREYLSSYRLLYTYKQSTRNCKGNDTLIVDQDNLRIKFDVINAYGNGALRYSFFFNNNAISDGSLSNELGLPSLEPDKYYRLSIVATDDVWKSNTHHIVVYMRPKWYQTQTIKKLIWLSIILTLVALVAISAFITKRLVLAANKKRNARMELELKSIYAQINPHFIFNSLNSALLLVSKQKTDEAYAHISKFSRLLRSYIKSSRNKHILLADEIKNLTNYIDLQQVRFKDKFRYNIQLAPDVDPARIFIPSLLLQPFVENAIEHGLLAKEREGQLLIDFKKQGNMLHCIIEDDGIGRKESKLSKIPNPTKEESYGELLIKDLVTIFNKYEHMNIAVDYEDKAAPLMGTIVTIKINLNGAPQI